MTTIYTVDMKEAKEELSELVNRVIHNNERIILSRRGKEIAALVPLEDLQHLQASQSKHDLEEAVEALKEVRKNGAQALDDIKDKLS